MNDIPVIFVIVCIQEIRQTIPVAEKIVMAHYSEKIPRLMTIV